MDTTLQQEKPIPKVRTLIVDDEPLARERLKSLLKGDPDVEITGECANGQQAIENIRNESPDLVFLDVQMPEANGFEVLENLDLGRMPIVVFVTAYDQYAVRAFEVNALDYLLKPYDRDRFEKALGRAKSEVALRRTTQASQKLLSLLAGMESKKPQVDRLLIRSAGKVFFLRVDDIDWVESSGNYVKLHVGNEAHLLRKTMSEMEHKLNGEKFARIHRSTIVNLDHIKELQPWFNGEYVVFLRNGTRLTASRGYRKRISEVLNVHE